MDVQGELRIDPGSLCSDDVGEDLELVVPYTEPALTEATLKRVGTLTGGLNARVRLIAIHTVPFPADFVTQASAHAFLVERLLELSGNCSVSVEPQVVLARSREDGFRHVLRSRSTILLGTRKQWLRTPEEVLARSLARDGHKVALLHVA